MWGKRQRDDDWDDEHRSQPEDRREQRPDDRREQRPDDRRGGYWDEPGDWAGPGGPGGGVPGGGVPGGSVPGGNGNRPGFGDRQGFSDADRQGFGDADRRSFGDSPWAEPQQRRGRGEYGGDPGFGDSGFGDSGFGGGRHADPRPGDPWQSDPRQSDPRQPDPWQPDPRPSDMRQPDLRQGDSRPGDPRRPVRDYPDAGFGQPGYGGRGGDFSGGDFGGDYRGGDRRDGDRRDMDRRDSDRRDGDRRDGGQWAEAGGWGQPEPEMPVPMFTPAAQVPSADSVSGPVSNGSAGTRPYGRLSIFTLLDDRVAEFDRMAEAAAEGVRIHEPDTLVYVMHVVPKAPLQRIIYEIYRDHAAFEQHLRQPHIQQFEEGRRPCVLVTNIIDLRLKYAKVAPIQGIPLAAPGQSVPPGQIAPPPGTRHRAPQGLEPDGNGWFAEPVGGQPTGGRPADMDGDWAADRSFDPAERRSQDWGQSQYSGQRYRDN